MLYTITKRYKVPARKGQLVRFTDVSGKVFKGIIICAIGSNLGVRFLGKQEIIPLHPKWNIEYL